MKVSRMILCGILCLGFFGVIASLSAEEAEQDDPMVGMVIGFLADTDEDMQNLAMEQIRSEVKGTAATEKFAQQLPDLATKTQIRLIGALRDRRDSAARPAMLELFSATPEEPVRLAVIEAFGFIGTADDLQMLVRILTEGSDAEKASARISLVRLSGEKVPADIAMVMQYSKTPNRVTLIEVLAERRAMVAIPKLLDAAVCDDAEVRSAAMTALGQLASSEHVALMIQGVITAEPGKEREAAEKNVMFVCKRIENPEERCYPILRAMKEMENADRFDLLSTLGRVGGPLALETIEKTVASDHPNLHDAGVRSLCNWPDASVAPQFMELLANDSHPDHQNRVLRALIRIAPLPDGRTDLQKLELLQAALALCKQDSERTLVLQRASAIRIVESLRFLVPYMDQEVFSQPASQSIVELAHHRQLRDDNKAEFTEALEKVKLTSKDPVVVLRAGKYLKGETWVRE